MVTSLQSEMAAEKSRSLSLQHQVNGGQNSLEGVRKELDEYRAKATKTLQSKGSFCQTIFSCNIVLTLQFSPLLLDKDIYIYRFFVYSFNEMKIFF